MAYIYQSGAWAAYDSKKYEVNTTTFTTYPFTINSPTTPIIATIYGNMVQTGTPTPTTPIQPSECGDLETIGEHAGQYKIPILNNSQITNVYLGEAQTVRNVKKRVLTGQETWYSTDSTFYIIPDNDYLRSNSIYTCVSTHYPASLQIGDTSYITQNSVTFNSTADRPRLYINDTDYSATSNFKAFLQQQYANGTPVTIWYVLATPETAVVNEPIRKIGDYSDTITTSIPVTINSDSVDITTTLKPSAVAAPSLSWGDGDDYKRSGGAWG